MFSIALFSMSGALAHPKMNNALYKSPYIITIIVKTHQAITFLITQECMERFDLCH